MLLLQRLSDWPDVLLLHGVFWTQRAQESQLPGMMSWLHQPVLLLLRNSAVQAMQCQSATWCKVRRLQMKYMWCNGTCIHVHVCIIGCRCTVCNADSAPQIGSIYMKHNYRCWWMFLMRGDMYVSSSPFSLSPTLSFLPSSLSSFPPFLPHWFSCLPVEVGGAVTVEIPRHGHHLYTVTFTNPASKRSKRYHFLGYLKAKIFSAFRI